MTANEDMMDGKARYFAPEVGVVIDNADPDGLYRVRARIPGIIEKTAWAYPVGTQGGGSKGRGAWTVPDVGADVVIMFIGGDVEHPVYMTAWWGIRPEGTEMPTETAAVDVTEAYKVQTIHESSRVKIWVDERPGKEQIAIQDKTIEENFIQIDLSSGIVQISALGGLLLNSVGVINIDGLQVNINGRQVLPDSKGI
jgi:hypothetical protein